MVKVVRFGEKKVYYYFLEFRMEKLDLENFKLETKTVLRHGG